MFLDLPTLVFTAALVIAFAGALLIIARGPSGGTDCLVVWGLAMLIGAAGMVMLDTGPDNPLVSDGFATAALLGATATSWTAARLFAERRASPVGIAAGPVLWLGTLPWHNGSAIWPALACLGGAAYSLATASELWRTRREPIPSRNTALTLMLAHAAVYGIRGMGLAAVGTLADGMGLVLVNVLIIESLLHTIGVAFLLLAMVKERLELRSIEDLRALTRTDGLTGIGNRRHFDDHLDSELRRSARNGPALALLLIDVDHFKTYNDAYGHLQGDTCLRQVAQRLSHFVRRPGDLAARYGGEEFAVVLGNADLSAAREMAERIRAAVEALNIPHPGPSAHVTVSIGVATTSTLAGRDLSAALLRAADQALYAAKRGGRNQVCAATAKTVFEREVLNLATS